MKKALLLSLITTITLFTSCRKDHIEEETADIVYKERMRTFVIGISDYAKANQNDFFIIPQNGIELVTTSGEADGEVNIPYLNAIDGHGQEDLFYGYDNDDEPTPSVDNQYLKSFLDVSKAYENTILVTDYCFTISHMEDSYTVNQQNGYISFAADHRELDNVPSFPSSIHNENTNTISQLSQVQNFLYLISPDGFAFKSQYLNAIANTNYDLVIMDLFFHDIALTEEDLNTIKTKANGADRLLISYMSIGEAEDYRYYWNSDWNTNPPAWMDGENPDWEGNFKVKYWDPEWQAIIFGNQESYLKKIVDAGFDGVYLDIIDAFDYYE